MRGIKVVWAGLLAVCVGYAQDSTFHATLFLGMGVRSFQVPGLNQAFRDAGINASVKPMHFFGEMSLLVRWRRLGWEIGWGTGYASAEQVNSSGTYWQAGLRYSVFRKNRLDVSIGGAWGIKFWNLNVLAGSQGGTVTYSPALFGMPNTASFSLIYQYVATDVMLTYSFASDAYLGFSLGFLTTYNYAWSYGGRKGNRGFPAYMPKGVMISVKIGD